MISSSAEIANLSENLCTMKQREAYFQRMVKFAHSMKPSPVNLETMAVEYLRAALNGIPFLTPTATEFRHGINGVVMFPVQARGESWTIVCEIKHSGQPRFVRAGAFQLRKRLQALGADHVYGMFIAPYLSEESTALLREESLGYLDFSGNCFLSFDGVFVERSGSPHTPERRQALREIFAPKASRVLRLLFTAPERSWRVAELAERAAVSLGLVSNVRRALLDREWASTDRQGLKLLKPATILDEWRAAYTPRLVSAKQYYTLLHGEALSGAMKAAFASVPPGPHLALASFSAAQWIAPFARFAGTFCYADEVGETSLKKALQLQSASSGTNVTVSRPKDDSVFIDRYQPVSGLECTGALQTYLDLSVAGERGREAAEHLRHARLDPRWSPHP